MGLDHKKLGGRSTKTKMKAIRIYESTPKPSKQCLKHGK